VSARDAESIVTIGVMSVATNLYLDYWKAMVQSAEIVSKIEDQVTFFVFTDNPSEVRNFSQILSNVKVKAFEISPYGWPEATLLRYQVFDSQIDQMDTDLLMHLDADMLFSSNPWSRIKQKLVTEKVCLVLHPGFWRPTGRGRLALYLRYPLLAYKDMRVKIKQGGLGAWESDPKSKAFVSRKLRKEYFCGGTWFGTREAINELITELAQQVSDDLANNYIAIWHDESHINNWATENRHTIENPELCFDETYPQIRNLTPSIIAVRKIEKTR
jgi:hypothetical protein